MLNVTSIKKGIVIDHIRAGLGMKIFELLNLQNKNYSVALIMNVNSKTYGKKDIIKIDNFIDIDLDELKLLDSKITINVIENEKIITKRHLCYPSKVYHLLHCNNPRCISCSERNIKHSLTLVGNADKASNKECIKYKCDYCEHEYSI